MYRPRLATCRNAASTQAVACSAAAAQDSARQARVSYYIALGNLNLIQTGSTTERVHREAQLMKNCVKLTGLETSFNAGEYPVETFDIARVCLK